MKPEPNHGPDNAILLFDGVCNLCNRWVDFVIRRDPLASIRMAALQSDEGKEVLRRHGFRPGYEDSIVLIRGKQVFRESDAALEVARALGWWGNLLYPLRFLPRGLRDAVYRWVAGNRYNWFGRRDSCRLPTAEDRRHFLEGPIAAPPPFEEARSNA